MAKSNRKTASENDEEITQILKVVVKRWRLVVALTLLAIVASLVASLVRSPTYEATALVAIEDVRYRFRFNPFDSSSLEGEGEQPPYNEIMRLAISASVRDAVAADLSMSSVPGASELTLSREMLEVEAPDVPSEILLTATAETPALAREIATSWAQHFIEAVNAIYPSIAADHEFFADQVAQAELELEQAQQALIEHQGENRISILNARLESLIHRLGSLLGAQNDLASLQQNVVALRAQVETLPPDSPSRLGDDLVALGLKIQALSAGSDVPVQIQLSAGESLSEGTVAEQIHRLASLEDSIEALIESAEEEIASLPDAILELQSEIQAAQTIYDALVTERNLAQDLVLLLRGKLAESVLLAESVEGGAVLGWEGAPPTKYTGPKVWTNIALAGGLGLIIGVIAAFVVEYLSPRRET